VSDDLSRIRRFIDALTRRERFLLLARVAFRTVVLAVAVELLLVFAAAGGWERSVATAGLVLLAGVGAWVAVVVPLARSWHHTGDVLRQARLVEALAPELRGRLLTAVERTEGPQGQESPALLGLIARRAAGVLDGVRPHLVHPARSVLRLAGATALLGLVGLVVAAVAPGGPFGTARWWLAGGQARAAAEEVAVDAQREQARVGDLVLQYTYPEYTGMDPVTVSNSTGDAHGPPGTRVKVTARSAHPVEAAALVAYDEPALDADVSEDGRALSGTFTIKGDPGTYHLVTYEAGHPLSSRDFKITPEPDLAPDVTVDAEKDILEIALDEPIPIQWHARDDYGISRVTLRVDGRDRRNPLAVPAVRESDVSGALKTRPMQLGLSPGDKVGVKVVAWDNDTYSGSKPGASRSIEIQVLGARGVDKRAEERQKALRDLMVTILADHLEEPWPAASTQGGLATWGAKVAKRYEPLDEAVEQYWTTTPPDTLEADVVHKVQRTGRELIRYTQVAFVPGSPERPGSKEIGVTNDLRGKAIVSLEDGILALDRIITLRALRHLSEDAKELATTAENLKEMMQGDPDVEEMLSRLDRLDRQLQQVMKTAQQLEEGGLQELVNQREGELQSLSDEIRKAIAEGRIDDARKRMDQLQREIQQLSEGIQDHLEQRVSQQSDAMSQAQALEQKLEKLEQKQLALQDDVRTLRQKSDAASAEKAEKIWEEIEHTSKDAVKKGQAYTKGLQDAGRTFNEEEVAKSASDQLEHLSESAAARDLNGMRQGVPQAQMDWRRVQSRQDLLESMSGRRMPGPGQPEVRAIQGDLDQIDKLLRQLEQISRSVSTHTARQIQQQQEQQQALQQELKQARQDARKLGRSFPVRPEGMEESLKDANDQMSQAGDDLQQARPMQAEGAQEMAAQGIRDARESLRRAMEQAAQQAQQLQSQPGDKKRQRGDNSKEGQDPMARVELPSPEEFRTPEEYRKALLEGMEGDVPEEYRGLKKRYYEELVHQ